MLQHRCLRSTGVGTAEAGETMKLYRFEAAGPNGRLQNRHPRHLTDLDRVHSPSVVVWNRLPTANRVRTRLGVLTPWVSASLAGAAGGRFLMEISMPLTQGPPRVTRSGCAPLSRRGNCEVLCMEHAPHVYSDAGLVLNVGTWTPVR